MARTLAIDIGGTKFSVAGFNGGELSLVQTEATDRSGGPRRMVDQIQRICQTWRCDLRFVPDRCAIGFGGPVDFPSQTVTMSTHVSGWARFPLVDEIRRIVAAPVVMDNDANVGALGERFFGAGRDCDPLFYVTLSTGIGGGAVIDGKVYRGADSFAGELGHVTVEPDGPECLCGFYGCLERMCCGLWLERDYGRSAKELLTDPGFVRRYVVPLARGLKAVIMILNPARVVIGGGISKAGEALFGPLREELNRQITSWSHARRDILPAQLGDQSVLYGALALADQYL
ncbi:MAG: ROK family protein [Acidobacteriaceae bacterium]|nr:ROK family protein [Acidobacteriaceae bacterium]